MSRHKTPETLEQNRAHSAAKRDRQEQRRTARANKYSPRVIY